MQYFVIASDGSRYGPADMDVLRQWIAENRVTPETMLEDAATGQRIPATAIDGLFQAHTTYAPMGAYTNMPGGNYAQPVTPVQYPRGQYDDSSSNITWAFVCFGIGVFACGLAPISCTFGLIQANKAIEKGNPSGGIARILNLVMLILGILVWLLYIVIIIIGVAGGFD